MSILLLAIPIVACLELHFQRGFELGKKCGAAVSVRLSLAGWGCFMGQSLHLNHTTFPTAIAISISRNEQSPPESDSVE